MTEVVVEEVTQAETPKSLGKKIISAFLKTLKFASYFAVFIGLSFSFSALSEIHGKEITEDYFVNGYPTILGLLNSEIFMGLIFTVTLSVFVYVAWLLWELHEVAVHKAQAIASHQIQLVFALSLCGLFIHKAWWVMAIIIAFTRWDIIAEKLSLIIKNGRTGDKK